MTSTDFTIGYPLTKKNIIQRLFEAGHIDFNEMWVLLQDEPEVQYIPMPQTDPWVVLDPPNINPYYTTSDGASNPRVHIPGRRKDSPEQS
jgi:hypothetical protein